MHHQPTPNGTTCRYDDTRLSLGCFKKLDNLRAAVSIVMAHYNWCWRTRDAINGRTRSPAAMLAGVTDRLWSFEDLSESVLS